MVSKQFSFRLPDEAVQVLESLQTEGETLNQTAQRIMIERLGVSTVPSQFLFTKAYSLVDIKELVKQEVEASLNQVRSQLEAQLEELRGKLKAR